MISAALADELSLEELIQRYRQDQNSDWVYHIIRRYSPFIAAFSMRVVRLGIPHSDIQHDLFLHLTTKLSNSQIHSSAHAWITTVIRHYLIDMAKKEQQRQVVQADYQTTQPRKQSSSGPHRLDIQAIMSMAKQTLSNTQARCLELFYIRDQSYKEIAQEMELSTKQVDNALRIARTKLKFAFHANT